MLPNVQIDNSEKSRILAFSRQVDMHQYIKNFLNKQLSDGSSKRTIRPEPRVELPKVVVSAQPPSSERTLIISVVSARAFLGFLDPDPNTRIVLDIALAGHRFRTEEAKTEADPLIRDEISFPLPQSLEELISTGCGSISAVIIAGVQSAIYGTGEFEWRKALTGYLRVPVDLKSISGDSCGVIDLKVQVSPPLCNESQFGSALQSEPQRGSYLCPLFSRLIPTPFHALRFSHLFSETRSKVSATGNIIESGETLNSGFTRLFSLHSILASRSGSITDICGLLCSFFIGFGFEAYVCGSKVLTVDQKKALLWDPSNCKTEIITNLPTVTLYGYKCKLDPLVENPSVDVDDPRIWKKYIIQDPILYPVIIPCASVDEEAIENHVKRMVSSLRNIKRTNFCKNVEAAIRPLLFSNENSAINDSCDYWNSLVKTAVQESLPPRHTISVCSINVHSPDAQSLFMALQSKASKLIHSTETEDFALTIGIFPYAENLYSTWILFGAILPLK